MPAREPVLQALVALHELRKLLDEWEPQLIGVARTAGASWTELAPVLGVASRQAAERRYLRLHRTDADAGTTQDQRVQAVRDRRAGDRAVTAWARAHGADLRQLAGQVSALTDLDPAAQPSLDRLHDALGTEDPAALIPLLAATREHLPVTHEGLAARVADVARDTDQARQDGRHGSRR
ncbi:hypothetical protein RB614_27725 [Phytohabitans sp. ZYX-F-186]|uniref:HSP18 transcriptional regulator n=1 Tax=Phytohabitans maris TaxID=3071409 RepID=A0ABU0ZMQ9_9ACTN|nr:hypothetical protein [Phytohabitans sp. ZYX-F-186]MDQ7908322.1 hypothetical protein [Phytohabitans sp. ZYX-F-186]